ncbi:MAG TPA: pilus assembly protein TadG-related protein, partial [Hyphomicrobiaceae bacterium]|nr:pilus assembly protein TadG-related protein [Hyphomicrobiaceae bacterium]
MSQSSQTLAVSFRRSEDGTIAMIFAICAFFLVMVTGLAIDVGRAMHANQKISDALDSAALAAAKGMRDQNLTDGEIDDLAKRYFAINMDGTGANYANVSELRVAINRGNNSIALDVDADVPTLFANIAGISKISFPRSAVAIYDRKDVEVGLQLDVTGSMHGRKLEDLKVAVVDLLDILMPDAGTTNEVRVALAPFSAGVNAGGLAGAVSNGRSSNGCVYERNNSADQDTDVAPVGKAALKGNLDLPGAGACSPNARVLPLSVHVVPGITSLQVLTAAHAVPLNE